MVRPTGKHVEQAIEEEALHRVTESLMVYLNFMIEIPFRVKNLMRANIKMQAVLGGGMDPRCMLSWQHSCNRECLCRVLDREAPTPLDLARLR